MRYIERYVDDHDRSRPIALPVAVDISQNREEPRLQVGAPLKPAGGTKRAGVRLLRQVVRVGGILRQPKRGAVHTPEEREQFRIECPAVRYAPLPPLDSVPSSHVGRARLEPERTVHRTSESVTCSSGVTIQNT